MGERIMDYGYDNTYKPEPTIEHIKELRRTDLQGYDSHEVVVRKLNEIIEVVNQLIPNKPKVWTDEELQAAQDELYRMILKAKHESTK